MADSRIDKVVVISTPTGDSEWFERMHKAATDSTIKRIEDGGNPLYNLIKRQFEASHESSITD